MYGALGCQGWRCCVNAYVPETKPSVVHNKVIWMLWFQGRDAAPPLVRACIDSWLYYNPTWRVVLLSSENLHRYVDDATLRRLEGWASLTTRSDVLRAYLLGRYGGLYTDATNLCTHSLDKWLPDALLQGHFIAWDPDSSLPTLNFVYAASPSAAFASAVDRMPDTQLYAGDYNRVITYLTGAVYNGWALPRKHEWLLRQPCESHGPPRPACDLGRGTKLIANSYCAMNQPSSGNFEREAALCPYQKLTWKYDRRNQPLTQVFHGDSRLMALLFLCCTQPPVSPPPSLLAPPRAPSLPLLTPPAPPRKPVIWLHIHKSAGTWICQQAKLRGERIVQPEVTCNYKDHSLDGALESGLRPRRIPCSQRLQAYQWQGATWGQIEREFNHEDVGCGMDFLYGITVREPEHLMASVAKYNHFWVQDVVPWLRSHAGRWPTSESCYSKEVWHCGDIAKLPVLRSGCQPDGCRFSFQFFDNFAVRLLNGYSGYWLPPGMVNQSHLSHAKQVISNCDIVLQLETLDNDYVQLMDHLQWARDEHSMMIARPTLHGTLREMVLKHGTIDDYYWLVALNSWDLKFYEHVEALSNRKSDASRARLSTLAKL